MLAFPETPSVVRHRWIELAVVALRDRFSQADYVVPPTLRVSVGWPKGSHGRGRAIGQCWSLDASSDKHSEIFVSPELGEQESSVKIMGVLAHEMVHATVGVAFGHKKPFKRCAEAVGLIGKMTSTDEGPEFTGFANRFVGEHGSYPAGRLSLDARKKQSTRLLKCECGDCGYVARITRKWLNDVGAPICPLDRVPLECEEA